MKHSNLLRLSAVALFAAPVLLTGCSTMEDMFGDTSSASHYDYAHQAPTVTTTSSGSQSGTSGSSSSATGSSGIAKKRGVTATTLADPVDAAVIHPKTSTAPASVPLAAPSVAQ
ncbi:hypothetical protein [Legionella sp. CNM-4043-24]|uniref:hypothetical protein n=1 Tax=Legionella sp. CNM-4043-24 TaxID=3421646 RepID=UPI00403AEEE6